MSGLCRVTRTSTKTKWCRDLHVIILNYIIGMATKDNSQKRVVPKTKDELIKMLSERLELAEVTQLQTQTSITEMQNTLEEEREKRETLSTELKEKEDKIAELIETESKTLQDV